MDLHEYWANSTQINESTFHFIFAFYMVVEIFGLSVNFIVLFYLIKVKVRKKSETYYLINLAVADLVMLLGVLPMNMVSSLNKRWMFGSIGCQIDGSLGGIFGFTSILTIMFMTIERFIVVRNPFTCIIYNKKLTTVCILITWIYSILWMALVTSYKGFYLEGILISCTFDYLSRDFYSRLIILGMFLGGFLIPLFIIIIFYFLIWYILKRNNSFDKFLFFSNIKLATKKSLNMSHQTRMCLKEEDAKNYNLFVQKEVSVAKRIIIMVISFCLAWLPYSICVLYGQFGSDVKTYVTPYSSSLPAVFAKSSSIYNPIIYVLTNNECKAYFMKRFIKKKTNFINNNNILANMEIKLPEFAELKPVLV